MPAKTSKGLGQRLAITTLETRSITFLREALINKLAYTRRHGYRLEAYFEYIDNDEYSAVWAKMPIMRNLLLSGEYEWVMWIDFDTVFTNLSHSVDAFLTDALENHLDSEQQQNDINLIIAPDCQPINAGVFLLRANLWSIDFLEKVFAKRVNRNESEQDAMFKLMVENKYIGEDMISNSPILIVPQHLLNAYPKEIKCIDNRSRHWEHGMWIAHFPGAWLYIKNDDPYGTMVRKHLPFVI